MILMYNRRKKKIMIMLKREKAIQLLIANGYDDTLATELPKLFVADYFEKGQELISEELDIFIDLVSKR